MSTHEDSDYFLCLTLVTRQDEKHLSLFHYQAQNLQSFLFLTNFILNKLYPLVLILQSTHVSMAHVYFLIWCRFAMSSALNVGSGVTSTQTER